MPLSPLPSLPKQLPHLAPFSEIQLEHLARMGELPLDISFTRLLAMCRGDVHRAQILTFALISLGTPLRNRKERFTSEARDGRALAAPTPNVADQRPVRPEPDHSTVLPSSRPDIPGSIDCKAVKDALSRVIRIQRWRGFREETAVGGNACRDTIVELRYLVYSGIDVVYGHNPTISLFRGDI